MHVPDSKYAKTRGMKIIQLSRIQTPRALKVEGTFTFLNAPELIYQLETVLEQMEAADQFEDLQVSFCIRFLDTRCKRIVLEYIRQFNDACVANTLRHVSIEWKYDGADEDMTEFGHLLNEVSNLSFSFIDSEIR